MVVNPDFYDDNSRTCSDGAERFYMPRKWRPKILSGDKIMTRRGWGSATLKRFQRFQRDGTLVALCGQSWDSLIHLGLITGMYPQLLSAMPRRDVLPEGGRVGQSPASFFKENAKFFKKERSTVTVLTFTLGKREHKPPKPMLVLCADFASFCSQTRLRCDQDYCRPRIHR